MCALAKENASCCSNAMRIIRYLDPDNQVKYAFEDPDGHAIELEGDILADLRSLDRPADVRKMLAPIAPSQILGIGLNYRRHAEETKAKIPDYPVLFGKGLNALQNPGDPILIPTHLAERRGRLRMRTRRRDQESLQERIPARCLAFRPGLYLRQ